MSDVLVKNFDLTPLNIIGFCDARFDINSKEKFYNYQTFNPEELETIDFDVLLFNLYNAIGVINNVMFQKLIDTKNENIFFDELLKPTAIFFLKQLFK